MSEPPPAPAEALAVAGLRALLVDDEGGVRAVLASELAGQGGWSVAEAEGPRAALARLEAGERCDLLVTDFAMPGMSGLALLREARRLRPGLPALLLTGFVRPAPEVEAALEAARADGPFAVLHKPVGAGALVANAAALVASPEAVGGA